MTTAIDIYAPNGLENMCAHGSAYVKDSQTYFETSECTRRASIYFAIPAIRVVNKFIFLEFNPIFLGVVSQ